MLCAVESATGLEGFYRLLVLPPRRIVGVSDDEIAAVAGASRFWRCSVLVFSDAGVHRERGVDASSAQSRHRSFHGSGPVAGNGLRNSPGLGPPTSCGFPIFKLRAEIFGTAFRFDVVHTNQSGRVDHEVDEALRDLLACCDVA